jgi:hypothetical protein
MKMVMLSVLGSIFLIGCNEALQNPANAGGSKEKNELATSAYVTGDKTFTDATGDLKILVRTCDFTGNPVAGRHCSYCALDQGWVVIGGGAEIEGSPQYARLRSSFPFPGNLVAPVNSPDQTDKNCTGNSPNNDPAKSGTAWMARSDGLTAHRLRAYVIGMQINGLSELQMGQIRSGNDATTAAMAQPSIEANLPGPVLMVGGGVDEVAGLGGTPNCYLTESRPDESTNSWRGSAYCNGSGGGNIKAYVITLQECPEVPGWNHCLDRKIRSVVSGAVTGYGSASVATPYPYVTTGIGGAGVVNFSSSRFLADLLPFASGTQGVSVTTKDHLSPVNGSTTAYSIGLIGGGPSRTWQFNGFTFSNSGGRLSRPSGAAPVKLMQSMTASGDVAACRWYLESVGSGQYQVRNANPSRPASGECAYRQSGTSNVLVGPCATANEYKWTISSPVEWPLLLKNVSSGTCLDNFNSTTNTAVGLKNCDSQFLYAGHSNWPP